jgi:flagellar biosynthesis protein FlhA
LLFPTFAMSLLMVLLVPLPTWLMDIMLALNITVAAIVLMTVIYIRNPLEFSVFPAMLLSLTLYRLVLNTATTRLILTNATDGTQAAGKVIQVFGQFVAAGSLAVGVIIFAILIVIQFVVITKGATRIAEVAARFTLDGMPGKQMAIDADLNAGLINEHEAKSRREVISNEADFYGAMDGASKFVRGDAIAGIIITFINILGGMYVGMVELNLDFLSCLRTFTILTIGDGLVSQIPAFIISISAGMIVTRSNAKGSLGEDLIGQLTAQPTALALSAGFLGVLAFTPLPKTPLILLGTGCAGLAATLTSRRSQKVKDAGEKAKAKEDKKEQKVETFLQVDPMELEVGYGLIKLVDKKQGGDLLDRISNIRKQTAIDLGIVVPPIRIRDNVQLSPNEYVIKLKGVEVAAAEVMPGHLMAIDSGVVSDQIGGVDTTEPAFGLPALWISESQRHTAEHRGYTVVEPSAVMGTHLTEVIKTHAEQLLTRQEVNQLLDTLKEKSPKLVEEVVPDVLKVGEVQKVLQLLLRERVPIRDLETVLETLGDWAPRTKDAEVLCEYVRNALARTICHQFKSADNILECVTLDPKLEEMINSHLDRTERGTFLTMPPAIQNQVTAAVRSQVEDATRLANGVTPVVLCSPQIRMWVRRLGETAMPTVGVLSYNEIVRGIEIRSRGMVTLSNEPENVPS